MQMEGYKPNRISTHAVEQSLLNQYIDDAIAWTYQLEGHECYVVTFPTIDITWCYDTASQMWHKMLAWNSDGSLTSGIEANVQRYFKAWFWLESYQNGKIYQLRFS